MATVEAFLEYGKIFGFFQKIRPPMFVMIFKDKIDGKLYPIYENNNDIAPGNYEIYLYHPYKTDGDKMQWAGLATIRDGSSLTIIRICFITGSLTAIDYSSTSSDDEKIQYWNEEVRKKGDRIQRYIGWEASDAIKMINA